MGIQGRRNQTWSRWRCSHPFWANHRSDSVGIPPRISQFVTVAKQLLQ
jgi:hypothetical protein